MKKFCLIGKDIENSLSPKIHKYIFKKFNLNADYQLLNIKRFDQLNIVLNDLRSNKLSGINITNPYKIDLYSHMEELTEACASIKAVNCVDYKENRIKGCNTDWFGFLKMMDASNISLIDKKIKIIGNGGAYNAIIYALSITGCASIELYDRENIDNFTHQKLDQRSIVINCTPEHFLNNDIIFMEHFIRGKYLWIDLLYTKLSTKKLKLINQKKKNMYVNGLDMLIFQALASIEIWFSKNIISNVDLDDLKKELNVK